MPAVTRLVLCFDGTWDRPSTAPSPGQRVETNVVRFYDSVLNGPQPDGSTQVKWYDDGVGAKWYDQFTGGVFGCGLDQKIQDGYRFLVEHYPDPDPKNIEVFVLGFSRGAYSARSLVGMIRNVGLLTRENEYRLPDAYALYRRRDEGPDTDAAQAFRSRYAREIGIRFLGVWDTVGALGIPLAALQWLNSAAYGFHDTELSGIVQAAAHAVAIDEQRVDFQPTLWTPIAKSGQTAEQRWFVGAHEDVGGGYADRRLSDLALAWMQDRATQAGLLLDPAERPALLPGNVMAPVDDSYAAFIDGTYALTHPRYYRPMTLGAAAGQVIDASVAVRYGADATYRPKNPGFSLGPPPMV